MGRIVLVHGSVVGGRATWREQRHSIGDRAELVVLERPGFEPPVSDFSRTRVLDPVGRVDFEEHAAWVAEHIEPRDHLVGHSYGGVTTLLAAAELGDALSSLTVIEPPCTSIALDHPAVAAFAEAGERFWRDGPTDDPDAFLRGFLSYVGSDFEPPSPLPPALERGARLLIDERGPWEAEIPLGRLAGLGLPTLVVSGAHHPAFDAICDVLERELSAERLVIPGHGHNPQLDPRFTAELLAFATRAE
ncbi:MAG: alpha/beta hydrolase [Actinobacteria bacterium]|nr:alpha/beta hydrolase [Actinomycetota bacterium]